MYVNVFSSSPSVLYLITKIKNKSACFCNKSNIVLNTIFFSRFFFSFYFLPLLLLLFSSCFLFLPFSLFRCSRLHGHSYHTTPHKHTQKTNTSSPQTSPL
mmetsp:Transcript_30311/g.55385  ORF Transcript_30311/g.55385 Transcript_30311/m.55385 type:complete len:100 (+) Transcript_30311:131-430(+)